MQRKTTLKIKIHFLPILVKDFGLKYILDNIHTTLFAFKSSKTYNLKNNTQLNLLRIESTDCTNYFMNSKNQKA
ncbi:hypothetical protein BW723_09270 [Polaribacter reichenbachii]|uniref:Uncharacterized protein n=1 Tax=Polaribacter reichenbachii TaxID=996801 RepID=A0A1B8U7F7_9FLAO|nr:hypothetical protein BW723_09270 [Polaribacter reichenbachii]AUC20339.1 hypothetical protein BTO17_17305 [Polaribacter reichenbachii]OBY67759.1 hypothetical protein LPB301_00230 [Polaribacter reichenbachii]